MNGFKLTFIGVKVIAIITFISALKTVGAILDFMFNRFEHPELYRDLPRSIIFSFGPFVTYLMISIVLWVFAKKIARLITTKTDFEIEIDLTKIFQISIAIVGIYLLTFDISGFLWIVRDYYGIYTGIGYIDDDSRGLGLDLIVNFLNMCVSIFLVLKANWISKKLHDIWKIKD